MRFRFGHPPHQGCLRFFHGTIKAKDQDDQKCYFETPIKWWFGLTFAKTFVGVIFTDGTQNVRESPKR